MRCVVQRVSKASVKVDGNPVSSIGKGILVLAAAAKGDGHDQVKWMAKKLPGLRIFPDERGKMNLSLEQIEGEALVVSQFTLYGDCSKGKRPSYGGAAPPDEAEALYEELIVLIRQRGIKVSSGKFRAMMEVELINDGPVTLILDSP
jgi:D-tyrosyl-tRNA(Tyr) deacylase